MSVNFDTECFGDMSMSGIGLGQSLPISDVDWKQDAHAVIAEDEIDQNTREFSSDNPRALHQQSWGNYFAQRSGQMGDISGTSHRRPRFSVGPAIREHREFNPNLGESTETAGFSVDGEIAQRSMSNSNNLPTLCVQDLMTPYIDAPGSVVMVQESEDEDLDLTRSADNLAISNLGPLFEECAINDARIQHSQLTTSQLDLPTDNKRDTAELSELLKPNHSTIERKDSIYSQISPGRAPQKDSTRQVADGSNDMQSEASTIQSANSNPKHQPITSTQMEGIAQFHRFIHFYVDCEQGKAAKRAKRCKRLVSSFAEALRKVHGEEITCESSTFNDETKQCTLFLLARCPSKKTDQWNELFLSVLASHTAIKIDANRIEFCQWAPTEM